MATVNLFVGLLESWFVGGFNFVFFCYLKFGTLIF